MRNKNLTTDAVRKLALAFEEAIEQPHFEKTSFRVRKKVFATMDENNKTVVVKLSLVEQSVYCSFEGDSVHPVAGGWGTKGWTEIDLKRVDRELFKDALTSSYRNTAPKKLAALYPEKES